jgi:cytochrome bd-type quinol oxidase subunit 2
MLFGNVGITLLISLGYYAAKSSYAFQMADWKLWLTLAFFILLTVLSHRSLEKVVEDRPARFANRFLAGTFIKLFLSFILFLVIVLTSEKEERLAYGIVFIISYLLFTVFGSREAIKLNHGREKG